MNGKAKEKLGKTMTVRDVPGALPNSWAGEILPYTEFEFVGYVPDMLHPDDPNYSWLLLPDGNYVNYKYPPSGLRVDILQEPGVEPPVEPPADDPPPPSFIVKWRDGIDYLYTRN